MIFCPMQIFKVEIRNHMALNEWSGDVHSTHTTFALTKRVFHAFQAAAMVKSVRPFLCASKVPLKAVFIGDYLKLINAFFEKYTYRILSHLLFDF